VNWRRKMNSTNEQRVYDALDLLGIEYTKYEHEAVFTIEEASQLNISIPGQLCKNLFLRNVKGDVHYLVVLDEAKQANLKLLAEQIGSTKLSFASEERLNKYLGLKPGSVSPYGLINDTEKKVIVLLDRDLASMNYISFHPNVNTATVCTTYGDFEKFLKSQGNKFYYIDVN
jgi:Ala-tRNA(Pro) deacylase